MKNATAPLITAPINARIIICVRDALLFTPATNAAAKIATQIALPHRNTGLSQLTAIQSPTVSKRFFLYIR